jgi:SAM-dependent methyltransferase
MPGASGGQEGFMTSKFEYEERCHCICGQPLSGAGECVHKNFPWGELHFLRCGHCGSWCQSPQISFGSLTAWFNSVDYYGSSSRRGAAYASYISDEKNRLEEAKTRYERDIEAELPKQARILEIGCATGSLLAVLRDAGHEVMGLDLSSAFAEAAWESHGISVKIGDPVSVDLPLGYFDAVILLGTLGNLQNLPAYLLRIRQVLKQDGVLIVNFPDANSWIVKYVYRARFWMFTPSVNCFMTSMGCVEALTRSGFSVQSLTCDRQKPSLRKFLGHSKMGFLIPCLGAVGLGSAALPFSIPLPGIRLLKARLRNPKESVGGN